MPGVLFGRAHSCGVHPGLMRKSISSLQCVQLEKTASVLNGPFTTSMVKKEFVRIHNFVRKTGKDSRVCFPGTDKLCIFLFKIAKYRLHQMP